MEQEEWGQKTNAANREGAAAADRELELHQHNNKKFQVLCVLIFKNLHPLTRVLHEMIDSNKDFFFDYLNYIIYYCFLSKNRAAHLLIVFPKLNINELEFCSGNITIPNLSSTQICEEKA